MAAKVALVTGSNGGLGKSVTLMLAKEGYKVWATMRDLSKGTALKEEAEAMGVAGNVKFLEMDVCSDESVTKAFKQVVDVGVRLDLLVNNAGFTVFGTVEMCSMEACKSQFETNVFGVIRCTKAALPLMRAQKSGKIVYISSIGGVWGQALNDVYCASKFAVEGMAECQCPLFREFGVYVSLVEPGGIKSDFQSNAKIPDLTTMPEEYHKPVQKVMQYYSRQGESQTPDEVSQSIMDQIVFVDAPPLRVQVNPKIQDTFTMQLADTTGEAGVARGVNTMLHFTPPAVRKPTVVIAGPPAAGKGTQSEKIKMGFGYVHIATGDILRENVKNGTELGLKAKVFMDAGNLVPSDLLINLVKDRISQPDCVEKGCLLDGFPRAPDQAKAMADAGLKVDKFLLIKVPDDTLVERGCGRRLDPETGSIYHLKFNPPPADIVDRLQHRSDDHEDKIRQRLMTYHAQIDGILPFFKDEVVELDGTKAPDEVYGVIEAALKAM